MGFQGAEPQGELGEIGFDAMKKTFTRTSQNSYFIESLIGSPRVEYMLKYFEEVSCMVC